MGLLDSLLGNAQQQQDLQNYVQRYQQGPPHEGYSDQEVLQRYQQVAPQRPPQDYQPAAEQAFNRMSPQQRAQFGEYENWGRSSRRARSCSRGRSRSGRPVKGSGR